MTLFKSKSSFFLVLIVVFIAFLPLLLINGVLYILWQQQLINLLVIQQIQTVSIVLFIFTGVNIILLSRWVAKNVVKPFRNLQEWSNTIGDHRVVLGVRPSSEWTGKAVRDVVMKIEQAFCKLQSGDTRLQAERDAMSITLASITEGVIAVDLMRRIVIFNRGAERITGFNARDVLGKRIDQLIRVFEANVELVSTVYCPVMLQGIEGSVFERQNIKIVGINDKTSSVNLIVSQIKEGLRANVGCILTLHDIAKESELEEMKLDFVSMAAHELRTPLTSIRGYLSVLIEESSHKLTSDEKSFMNNISIAVEQLMGLIENLLSVARIERSTLTISMESVDWVSLVREVVSQFLPRASRKNIDLVFLEPPDDIPKIEVDKVRIVEVISNLISNAISYTDEYGKVKVGIEVRNQEIITHVEDTGEGISENALPNMFTKFYRVVGRLGQGSKGTGLGLYIAKAIVELHKGRIWVVSEVGKGSVFSFSLPLK